MIGPAVDARRELLRSLDDDGFREWVDTIRRVLRPAAAELVVWAGAAAAGRAADGTRI